MPTKKKTQASKAKPPLSRRVGYKGAKYSAAVTVGTCRKIGHLIGGVLDAGKEIGREVRTGIKEYRDE
jgi:hypothetical protein